MSLKKMYGQFYTISNPFKNRLFFNWYESIPEEKKNIILEPFAGANNILQLIEDVNIRVKEWDCYDLFPNNDDSKNKAYEIKMQDTLQNFPKGYSVVITNPPYLAKNKATKDKIPFDNEYEDLYLKALDIMLKNTEYVAAIIPESYITSNKYIDRLYGVVSLEMRMFEDTEVPVCLALFIPNKNEDFYIYKNDIYVGNYKELKKYIIESKEYINIKFNDENGNLGFIAIDDTKSDNIKFTFPNEIKNKVNISSRSKTKISGINFKNENQQKEFIKKLNETIAEYRKLTKDVFLTSFKGLRKDNKYRRRMDYKTARNIINKVYNEFNWSIYE